MIRNTVELSGVGLREGLKGHQFLSQKLRSLLVRFENQATALQG